jgi:hypothetical protein
MNVPEVWITAPENLNVLTLLEVFHADVTMGIPEMARLALVGDAKIRIEGTLLYKSNSVKRIESWFRGETSPWGVWQNYPAKTK